MRNIFKQIFWKNTWENFMEWVNEKIENIGNQEWENEKRKYERPTDGKIENLLQEALDLFAKLEKTNLEGENIDQLKAKANTLLEKLNKDISQEKTQEIEELIKEADKLLEKIKKINIKN